VQGPRQLRAKLGSWLALSPFATVKDQRALTAVLNAIESRFQLAFRA